MELRLEGTSPFIVRGSHIIFCCALSDRAHSFSSLFIVCGSTGIAGAVRSALSYNPTNILRGGATVSLHVESFGIA